VSNILSIDESSINFEPLSIKTLPFFVETRNSVRNMLHDSRSFSFSEALDWFKVSKVSYWIIFLDNLPVGYFRFIKIEKNIYQIGADINPDFQRKRIASIAYPLFIDLIAKPLKCRLLKLRVLKSNFVAINFYSKMEFYIIGETELDYEMQKEIKY
jgi:RimJ/RimL family protein N-acetyltransferase